MNKQKNQYCLMDLENCLIRFILMLNDFKNCSKSEVNDFEIQKDILKEELKQILDSI